LIFQESVPIYHPAPNISRRAHQLTEEEQIKIAKRIGLINHLPTGIYDGSSKKIKE
jgi:E3 ubiquitin-protein ligase RNF11